MARMSATSPSVPSVGGRRHEISHEREVARAHRREGVQDVVGRRRHGDARGEEPLGRRESAADMADVLPPHEVEIRGGQDDDADARVPEDGRRGAVEGLRARAPASSLRVPYAPRRPCQLKRTACSAT